MNQESSLNRLRTFLALFVQLKAETSYSPCKAETLEVVAKTGSAEAAEAPLLA